MFFTTISALFLLAEYPDMQKIEPVHDESYIVDNTKRESLELNPRLDVQRFETPDGRPGWKVRLERSLPLATPAISDGMLFIGGGFGSYEFYALDAETGRGLWLFHCGDDGPTAAVVQGNRVAFNTESCILYVLDTKTGRKIWGEWLGDPLMSQPAISGDLIYMTYPTGRHHALSCLNMETGEKLWTATIPGEVISTPVLAKDRVYAATLEGSVHCFNARTGEKIFSKALNATSAPWIWHDKVFVSMRQDLVQDSGTVRHEGQAVLNDKGEHLNKKSLWASQKAEYLEFETSSKYATKQAQLDESVGFGGSGPAAAKLEQSKENLGVASVSGVWAYQGSRPCIVNNTLFTCMGDTLKALDPNTGKLLWKKGIRIRQENGGRPLTPPSYADGRLYLGTVSGEIICFDALNGQELWRYDCGEPIRFQPAIYQGKVYWGTDQGTVFCIAAKNPNAHGWLMWGGNAQHNGLAP